MQTTASQERTDALLRDLWLRKLPKVREHLSVLECARDTLKQATLPASQRTESISAAHKLAGSLGMFGYDLGTELARKLEIELDSDRPPDSALFARLVEQLTASLNL